MDRWSGNQSPPRFVPNSPIIVTCPECGAPPGEKCQARTDNGFRQVEWFHLKREDATP